MSVAPIRMERTRSSDGVGLDAKDGSGPFTYPGVALEGHVVHLALKCIKDKNLLQGVVDTREVTLLAVVATTGRVPLRLLPGNRRLRASYDLCSVSV